MMVVAMSQGELTRYDMLVRVERGEMRIEDAAQGGSKGNRCTVRPL